MNEVWVVQYLWRDTECCDCDIEIFHDYIKASGYYETLKNRDLSDEDSWVRDIFNADGSVNEDYNYSDDINENTGEKYWEVSDSFGSFICISLSKYKVN